ncbi:UMP kinase [Psittacicella hinzii]|nr:UMP kinase [Psittacicella hinzii]
MSGNKPLYNRILLKLSGEALQGNEGFGIDPTVLDRIVAEVKRVTDLGVQVAIVVGGGNLFRGAQLAQLNMNRVVGDHMGMLATVMNGLAIRDSLFRAGLNCTLMSPLALTGVCEIYNWSNAIKALNSGRVVVFGGGTGNPFFTTDSAACLRGIEIAADVVLKATNVDGVYDSDPRKNPDAKRFVHITYDDVIAKELKVMDLAAFTLARDHKLPIRVFNIHNFGDLERVVTDPDLGTLITE